MTGAGKPEFSHQTVLLSEAVESLLANKSGSYVDGTFGRGGHSRKILSELNADGKLLAIDKDPAALEAARQLMQRDSRLLFIQGSFADLKKYLEQLGWSQIEGVLLDLGVSSPQLDDPCRGFSFQHDGPLDMRMDFESGESAADWLQAADEQDITRILWDFGEERYSRRIARAIVAARREQPIASTARLADIIAKAHPRWEKGKHPATRSFQAIRIYINDELGDLSTVLKDGFDALSSGGRLVVISFHSLEDRIVKRFMKQQEQGESLPKWVPVQNNFTAKARIIARKVRASDQEVRMNARSRSAIMRVLEKL